MLLTRYGLREWGTATIVAAVLAAIVIWQGWCWALIPIALLWVGIAGFFRDPLCRRPASDDPDAMVSPADGRITAVERLPEHEATDGKPALLVRIFLSVLNVHLNRASCEGVVKSVTHRPGKYLDARSEESARVNESNLVVMVRDNGDLVGIRQVSGAIARRIVCPVGPGDRIGRGQRYGMIKFGSTTELIVPDREGNEACVKVGDKVRGGVDILVRLAPPES
ncbi:MAG: phosphatidylserine decarboxylase [Phycisphaerales bacterium]|nr:phosphatidylserine decarboxylase [Phycisphaerales bacterium]